MLGTRERWNLAEDSQQQDQEQTQDENGGDGNIDGRTGSFDDQITREAEKRESSENGPEETDEH
jgi:hypothetical protein